MKYSLENAWEDVYSKFAQEISDERDKDVLQKMIWNATDDKIFTLKVSLKEVD